MVEGKALANEATFLASLGAGATHYPLSKQLPWEELLPEPCSLPPLGSPFPTSPPVVRPCRSPGHQEEGQTERRASAWSHQGTQDALLPAFLLPGSPPFSVLLCVRTWSPKDFWKSKCASGERKAYAP